MNSEIINIIEKKRNELRNNILRKKIFVSKTEKEILNKYDNLLMDQYNKLIH